MVPHALHTRQRAGDALHNDGAPDAHAQRVFPNGTAALRAGVNGGPRQWLRGAAAALCLLGGPAGAQDDVVGSSGSADAGDAASAGSEVPMAGIIAAIVAGIIVLILGVAIIQRQKKSQAKEAAAEAQELQRETLKYLHDFERERREGGRGGGGGTAGGGGGGAALLRPVTSGGSGSSLNKSALSPKSLLRNAGMDASQELAGSSQGPVNHNSRSMSDLGYGSEGPLSGGGNSFGAPWARQGTLPMTSAAARRQDAHTGDPDNVDTHDPMVKSYPNGGYRQSGSFQAGNTTTAGDSGRDLPPAVSCFSGVAGGSAGGAVGGSGARSRPSGYPGPPTPLSPSRGRGRHGLSRASNRSFDSDAAAGSLATPRVRSVAGTRGGGGGGGLKDPGRGVLSPPHTPKSPGAGPVCAWCDDVRSATVRCQACGLLCDVCTLQRHVVDAGPEHVVTRIARPAVGGPGGPGHRGHRPADPLLLDAAELLANPCTQCHAEGASAKCSACSATLCAACAAKPLICKSSRGPHAIEFMCVSCRTNPTEHNTPTCADCAQGLARPRQQQRYLAKQPPPPPQQHRTASPPLQLEPPALVM